MSCLRRVRAIHHIPTRVMCIMLIVIQAAIMDYYLAHYKTTIWLSIISIDVVVIVVFLIAMVTSYKQIQTMRLWKKTDTTKQAEPDSMPFGFISWGVYSIGLCIKVIVIFDSFAEQLDENEFFGPNTLKTAVGISGLVFMLFLMGLHDAPRNSKPKQYIEELTGTVIFDIIDAVDSMEILFNKEARDNFLPGMEWAIVIIACINFMIPTIPLVTLTRTKFGHRKLSDRLVVIHKVMLAFAVNLPLAISRLVVWHGFSQGISLFLLKNILMVGIISYDLYEHWMESEEKRESKSHGVELTTKTSSQEEDYTDAYALEDRYNYS